MTHPNHPLAHFVASADENDFFANLLLNQFYDTLQVIWQTSKRNRFLCVLLPALYILINSLPLSKLLDCCRHTSSNPARCCQV